jgi:glycosyltransferase involved in cell wall biosynthesis
VTTTEADLVSLCIPTYNGAEHLRECLDSAIAQTYPSLEILILDDCSTDETVEIATNYARQHARIRVIRNDENRGLVGNWNRCVDLARGEWIKFLFQDDYLEPSCVETMRKSSTHPIVFCRRKFLFANGTNPEIELAYRRIPDLVDLFPEHTDVRAEQICELFSTEHRNVFGEPTSALLHRSAFERFGYFNPSLRQICDLEYWIRVASNTGVSIVAEQLATFRYHSSSTSASNQGVEREERITLFDELVLLHEFAYNPAFDALRGTVGAGGRAVGYRRRLGERATWVAARARAQATDETAPDLAWLEDWNRLVIKYPRLADESKSIGTFTRDIVNRHLTWRLRK